MVTRPRNIPQIDPYFDSVVLLCPFSGEDGDTTSTDLSNSAHTLTFAGDTSLDKDIRKYGFTSCYFDGAGGDKVTVASSSDFAFGTGDFTIEFWARFSDITDINTIAWDGGYLNAIYCNANSGMSFYSDTNLINVASGTVALNTWYHIALTRSSGTFNLFQDGVSQGTSTASRTFTASEMRVGSGDVNGMNGWLENVRITKGVCRYTENFTPPAGPYPTSNNFNYDAYVDNVTLLLPFDGTDGATSTTDLSNENHPISFFGTAQLDTATKKFGTASLLLDGNSDYVTAPHSTTLTPESGSFTAEAHVTVRRTTGNTMRVFGVYYATSTNKEWLFGYNPTVGELRVFISDNGTSDRLVCNEAWSPTVDTWYHIAMVIDRDGGTDVTRIFVDGVQLGTDDTTINSYPTINEGTQALYIGRFAIETVLD